MLYIRDIECDFSDMGEQFSYENINYFLFNLNIWGH